jgi:hypothetical protein
MVKIGYKVLLMVAFLCAGVHLRCGEWWGFVGAMLIGCIALTLLECRIARETEEAARR